MHLELLFSQTLAKVDSAARMYLYTGQVFTM